MKTTIFAMLAATGMITLAACDRASDGPAPAASNAPEVSFDVADANHDGRITAQEALEVPGLNFDRMDADKNMAVSPQEFATAKALARDRG